MKCVKEKIYRRITYVLKYEPLTSWKLFWLSLKKFLNNSCLQYKYKCMFTSLRCTVDAFRTLVHDRFETKIFVFVFSRKFRKFFFAFLEKAYEKLQKSKRKFLRKLKLMRKCSRKRKQMRKCSRKRKSLKFAHFRFSRKWKHRFSFQPYSSCIQYSVVERLEKSLMYVHYYRGPGGVKMCEKVLSALLSRKKCCSSQALCGSDFIFQEANGFRAKALKGIIRKF
jgi:hypothetical protein